MIQSAKEAGEMASNAKTVEYLIDHSFRPEEHKEINYGKIQKA